MRTPRSTALAALATACALVLGLLALLGSVPPTALAWPGDRTPGPAFVAPGGVDGLCTQDAPCASLQYAIDQSTPGNGDVIYVAGGVYTGTGEEVIVLTKTVALYGGWNGAASGALVRDPAAFPTTLDGEYARRVVDIASGSRPTMDGFPIVRGNASGLTATCTSMAGDACGCGGGILSYGASPIIVGNTISANVAFAGSDSGGKTGYGGSVMLVGGLGVLRGNLIQGNVASNANRGRGGGVEIEYSAARIEGNRILSNTAAVLGGGGYGSGGGIGGRPWNTVIVGNVLEGNLCRAGAGAGAGAAIYEGTGSALYSGNRVRANQGSSAVYLGTSRSRFEGNLVLENATTDGIYLVGAASPPVLLANNIVVHGGAGAALATQASAGSPLTATLLCNTLVGSGAGSGVSAAPYTMLVLTDNIVTGFSWGISVTEPASSTVLADHTLFWANGDDGLRGTAALDADPCFVDAAARDYHIGRASAARDAGAPVDAARDMDGDPRSIGLQYDIGADEYGWVRRLPLVLRP